MPERREAITCGARIHSASVFHDLGPWPCVRSQYAAVRLQYCALFCTTTTITSGMADSKHGDGRRVLPLTPRDTPPDSCSPSELHISLPETPSGRDTPNGLYFTPRRAMASFENLVALANHQERLKEARKMVWRVRGEPVVELPSIEACLRHAATGGLRRCPPSPYPTRSHRLSAVRSRNTGFQHSCRVQPHPRFHSNSTRPIVSRVPHHDA